MLPESSLTLFPREGAQCFGNLLAAFEDAALINEKGPNYGIQ
jgi:hypothetical protein